MPGILAPNIYDAGAIFCQFSDIENGGQSQQHSIFGQLVSGEPQCTGSSHLRKANLIFQWVSVSNATLLLVVFFACGVHKLNYIKSDFV